MRYINRLFTYLLTYYLSTDAIIWDYSGGDTFCRMCRGCGLCSFYRKTVWTVWFLKTESKPNFGFPHIPSAYVLATAYILPVTDLTHCCAP